MLVNILLLYLKNQQIDTAQRFNYFGCGKSLKKPISKTLNFIR